MKPFVLKQHDKDFSATRVLRDEELTAVYGGLACDNDQPATCTVTPDGDGGFDGCDDV